MDRKARAGLVLGVTLALVVLAEGLSASAAPLPAAEELVPNTVARISHVPERTGTITEAELRHGLVLAATGAGLRRVPKSGGRKYERLARVVLDSLLERIWIRGLAAEMNTAVTGHEVKRQLALIKKQSFNSGAEYRQFLRESRFTRRDVFERVEIEMLAERIQVRLQRQIEREARNEYEEQKAFEEFVAEFNERWRARTVCAPAYATERCSNGRPARAGHATRTAPS